MRYFFDVSGAGLSTRDSDGQELTTREDAIAQAGQTLAEIALHHLWTTGEPTVALSVVVREGGKPFHESYLVVGSEQ
jgi:hypothetical protein